MALGTTRQSIRTQLDDALTSISTVGDRVQYGEIDHALPLPNIAYTIEDESFATTNFMNTTQAVGERALRIVLEARALLRDGSDYPIDDLCLEIEKVMATASTLNSLVKDLRLGYTEYTIEEDDKPIGLAMLEYVGFYS